jgi:hypothetical protein
VTIEHLDDQGQPCARHPAATIEELMFLAIVGSRASGFHHDLASKLQGLMMSLDEIGELSESDPQLTRAAQTSLDSLREVLALLNVNRALTKPPVRTAVAFREILARAAERVYVSFSGEIVDATIETSAPAMIHALSLALDVAAGPGRGRTLSATARLDDTHVELRLACSSPPPSNSGESLAIATFVLERDRGSLRCSHDGALLIVRLPLVAA